MEKQLKINDVLDDFDGIVGMSEVKRKLKTAIRHVRSSGNDGWYWRVFVFVGNNHSGKKMFAMKMAEILYRDGVIESDRFNCIDGQKMGGDLTELENAVKEAKGAVLYVENTCRLKQEGVSTILNSFSGEGILILTCFPFEWRAFLSYDKRLSDLSDLSSCHMIDFDGEYEPLQLKHLLKLMAERADQIPEIWHDSPIRISKTFLDRSYLIFKELRKEDSRTYMNPALVMSYLNDSIDLMKNRRNRKEDCLSSADIPDNFLIHLKYRHKMILEKQIATDERKDPDPSSYMKSVVLIEKYRRNHKKPFANATGTIITKDGFVVTCFHCLKGADRLKAILFVPDGKGGRYPVSLDCDICSPTIAEFDLAVLKLKIEGASFDPVSICPSDREIRIGERVFVPGYPLAYYNFASYEATVSMLPENREEGRYHLDGKAYPGNSGSPVISYEDGRMIGYLVGTARDMDHECGDPLFYPVHVFWKKFVSEASEQWLGLDLSSDDLPF